MDTNQDGVVTLDEFIECCRNDDAISRSMNVFDTSIWPERTAAPPPSNLTAFGDRVAGAVLPSVGPNQYQQQHPHQAAVVSGDGSFQPSLQQQQAYHQLQHNQQQTHPHLHRPAYQQQHSQTTTTTTGSFHTTTSYDGSYGGGSAGNNSSVTEPSLVIVRTWYTNDESHHGGHAATNKNHNNVGALHAAAVQRNIA